MCTVHTKHIIFFFYLFGFFFLENYTLNNQRKSIQQVCIRLKVSYQTNWTIEKHTVWNRIRAVSFVKKNIHHTTLDWTNRLYENENETREFIILIIDSAGKAANVYIYTTNIVSFYRILEIFVFYYNFSNDFFFHSSFIRRIGWCCLNMYLFIYLFIGNYNHFNAVYLYAVGQ